VRSAAPSILLALLATAMSLPGAAQDTMILPEQRGQQLVETHSAICHAIGRTGASPHRKAPPFRILARRYPIERLEEPMAEGIVSAITGPATTPKEKGCDLIVMALHGRRGIARRLLGSQANEVLTHSKVPALILR